VSARRIDQNAPHHLRGDGEELSATLPVDVFRVNQSSADCSTRGMWLVRVSLAFVRVSLA
jgi:hypothetical protein